MITKEVLNVGGVTLRQIELDDCTTTYVDWLNDPEVNQYLETRWSEQSLESIRGFVESQRNNNHSILFAIILCYNSKHIGNIKIGPINNYHKHADISYFIGDKSMWNKGIATAAIKLTTGFGFEHLDLHRIEAGAYSASIGSWKALEKNGFKREAVFREQVMSKGQWMDVYRYGILKRDFQNINLLNQNHKRKYE